MRGSVTGSDTPAILERKLRGTFLNWRPREDRAVARPGAPEAALIGVQYRGNDRGEHRGPWIARDTKSVPWLFDGTGIRAGDTFGTCGIEIDKTFSSSPKNVHVIAEIPNLFGPGFTAQMTYYETPAGARVFAAGAFTLAGQAGNPVISKLLSNLWQHLTVES